MRTRKKAENKTEKKDNVHSNTELKGSLKTTKDKREMICIKSQQVGGRRWELLQYTRQKEKVSNLGGKNIKGSPGLAQETKNME